MCFLESFHATGHDSDEDYEELEGYEGLNLIYPIFRMSSIGEGQREGQDESQGVLATVSCLTFLRLSLVD